MSQNVLDLGVCPRCKDAIDNSNGLKSKIVAYIKLCIFCALHVESHQTELERYVAWAKEYKKRSEVNV
jgi:hypothetical protein